MGEISLDASTVNKFISSLSKSIQALCHGCMDFDNSIEMIGYINISIDSDKIVDCVLNEKVRKSAANSITCISNSFPAKKDKPKQTKESSCSPIRHSQHLPINKRQYSDSRDLAHRGSVRKKYRYHPKQVPVPSYEQYSGSDGSYNEQTTTVSVSSDFPNSEQIVKTETQDNVTSDFDQSASTSAHDFPVKKEMDASASETLSESQDGAVESGEFGNDYAENFVQNSDKNISETTLKPSSQSHRAETSHAFDETAPLNFEHKQENIGHFESEDVQHENSFLGSQDAEDSHSLQSQQHDNQEESCEGNQFEVIEIGDDDEEMQGFFEQTGTQRMMEAHHQSQASGSVYQWRSHNNFSSRDYLSLRRERKNNLARIHRLNRTSEQIERERWLARMRQRRRRAKLRGRGYEESDHNDFGPFVVDQP